MEPGQNEISRIGHSLAEHGAFADPFIIPTGPTAHHAPVYPLLVAAIYKWVPQKEWIDTRVGLNIVLSSAACAFAFLAGIAFGLGGLASFLGAAVLAAAPSRLAVEICNDQEATLIALIAVVATWKSAELVRSKDINSRLLLATGLIWGFGLLAAPSLLLVFACFVAWLLIQRRYRAALFTASLAGLVLLPWMVRDRVVLGGWVPIRDSLWLELRVSNDDRAVADPSVNAETGAMQLYHPLFNTAAAERVKRYGEIHEYDRLKGETIQWIESHPGRFAELTLERFQNFWMPIGTSRIQRVYRVLLYAFGATGLGLLCRSDRRFFLLASIFVVVYPLPYYLTQSYSRYAYPMEWLETLLAAYSLLWTLSLIRSRIR